MSTDDADERWDGVYWYPPEEGVIGPELDINYPRNPVKPCLYSLIIPHLGLTLILQSPTKEKYMVFTLYMLFFEIFIGAAGVFVPAAFLLIIAINVLSVIDTYRIWSRTRKQGYFYYWY